MPKRTVEQILNGLPKDEVNSLEERPSWLLSVDTIFPEGFPFPKVEPIISSVALNPDNPAYVEVVTSLGTEVDGLTAVVLADALNRKINSKVMAFLSEDTQNSYGLVITTEKLRQVVESNGLSELASTAANHDIIRAIVPSILAEIDQDYNSSDFPKLQKRVDELVKDKFDNLFKGE